MSIPLLKALLALSSVAALALGVRLAGWPVAKVELAQAAAVEPRTPWHSAPARLDSLAAIAVGRNPFRLTRRPAPVAYDPLQPDPAYQPPPPPKPALALTGIVWDGGRDPTALLEGVPGAEGPRVVRVGDLVGGLTVHSITREAVRIVGMDTVWVLKVREPWR